MNEKNAVEWYRKYRPTTLKEVVGQVKVTRILRRKLKQEQVPQVMLFVGPSGVGKTTIARILKQELGCSDMDWEEVPCATIETPSNKVRDIQQLMGLVPVNGKCRIWYLDEFQSLIRSKFAQEALLSILENTPKHVYFILAATDPGKIIRTIRTRCTIFKLRSLSIENLIKTMRSVLEKEQVSVEDSILRALADASGGSARQAVVDLQKIAALPTVEEQLAAIHSEEDEEEAITICRTLMDDKKRWIDVVHILRDLKEDPEEVRRAVLGYAGTALLNDGNRANIASTIIDCFECNFYDGQKAALFNACYKVLERRG